MSLIFDKISASCPYKLCPYSIKKSVWPCLWFSSFFSSFIQFLTLVTKIQTVKIAIIRRSRLHPLPHLPHPLGTSQSASLTILWLTWKWAWPLDSNLTSGRKTWRKWAVSPTSKADTDGSYQNIWKKNSLTCNLGRYYNYMGIDKVYWGAFVAGNMIFFNSSNCTWLTSCITWSQ